VREVGQVFFKAPTVSRSRRVWAAADVVRRITGELLAR